jgi:putative membrane protein
MGVLCCVALTGFALAQQNNGQQGSMATNTSSSLPSSDQQFLDHLAKDSRGEVQISKMVEAKTTNPEVKDYAKRMIHDHMMMDRQLHQVMAKHGLPVPQGITSEDQQLQSKLQGLSGQQLDQAYMRAQIQDHEQDVQQVSQKAKSDQQLSPAHPDVAQFAQESLPVLQDHLQLAKSVGAKVGVSPQ